MASIVINCVFKSIGFNIERQGMVKFELRAWKFTMVAICQPLEEQRKNHTKKVQFEKVEKNGSSTLKNNKLDKLQTLIRNQDNYI